ncbi:ATP-grasp domain-containing protein [Cohnella sp. 56]|uniref:ATP-grasp domain-containing protein n=1 Tax=Cohnella sp. 56 TaxID=3113722 RepID=UPI0030E8494E
MERVKWMAGNEYEWAPLGVEEIRELFAGWPGVWGIAGGWALDMHLGRQTRPHDDIDVLLTLDDYAAAYERLSENWELHLAENGKLTRLGPQDRLEGETDIWARRDAQSPWAYQLMLIDVRDGMWTYRRAPSVRKPAVDLMLRADGGIPYLRPEVQLLYKGGAASIRDKDRRDLEAVLPCLTEAERMWLREALHAQFPQGHSWLLRLRGDAAHEARGNSVAGELRDRFARLGRSDPPATGGGTTRPYLKLIQRAAAADGVSFEPITPDLTYRARREEASFLMTDAELGLNPSSAAALALSKSAAADALRAAGVPAVEHRFLPHPGYRFGDDGAAVRTRAVTAFAGFGGDAVVKPDDGAQGRHVYRARSRSELHAALDAIYALERHAAISPYREAELEYRVVVLAGEARVWLGKRRHGSWKHNLAEGARSVEVPAEDRARLSPLAVRAAAALDMVFCSVDILDTAEHGPLVIELNHKVMLGDHYKQHPESEAGLSALYRDAIALRFGRR